MIGAVRAWQRLAPAVLVLALAGSAVAGSAAAAPASSVVGTGTPGSCTEGALDAAVALGGDITFNCGGPKTIALSQPVTIADDPVTIDGGSVITLTGSLTTTLFVGLTGSRLGLSHIRLEQGYNHFGNGGAITAVEDLTLDDVTIQSSSSGEFGGAIFVTGSLTMRHSRLLQNQAPVGGAIYTLGGVDMTIADSTLQLNDAFDSANGHGGAIYLGSNSTLTVIGGELGSNAAHGFGGALYLAPGAQATFEPSGATAAEVDVNSGYRGGGGIYNDGGTLALYGARVEGNQTLTTHVSFFDNRAADDGGGLYTNVNSTTVSLADDLFADNQAEAGGGLARTNAHLSIAKSSFTANQAQFGGGLFVQGLPDADSAGYVEIQDTTISGNQAASQPSGGIENYGRLDLRNVTLKDNHFGLWDANGAKGTTARLQSTVLDNPGGGNCAGDGSVAPDSAGHNLASDSTCNLSARLGDQSGVAAQLGPLTSDPAVFTEFHMPQPGSPLINTGGPGCSPTDQRYALRPDACDIGAVEFGGLLPRLFAPLIRK